MSSVRSRSSRMTSISDRASNISIDSQQLNRMPLSVINVQRIILATCSSTQVNARTFKRKYIHRSNYTKEELNYILECFKMVQQSLSSSARFPRDSLDTRPELVLEVMANNRFVRFDEPEFFDLERIAQALSVFQQMRKETTERLDIIIDNYLYKYCLSFIEESEELDLPPVANYQKFIDSIYATIEAKRQELETLENEKWRFDGVTMSDYILKNGEINKIMGEWCQSQLQLADVIKQWLTADRTYPRKLQSMITFLGKRSLALTEKMQTIKNQMYQVEGKVKKAEFWKAKKEQQLKNASGEKVHYQRRITSLEPVLLKITKEIGEINTLRNKSVLMLQTYISPSVQKVHGEVVEVCEGRFLKAQQRLNQVYNQIEYLRKEQKVCDEKIQIAQDALNNRTAKHNEALEEVAMLERVRKSIEAEIEAVHKKVEVLKKIREIKLHSDTIRKIYHYGYNPGQYQEVQDEMDQIFKELSAIIGKKWPQVYQKLPFKPKRSINERANDIEVLDISQRRMDASFPDLAYKSLQKWRRLSQSASVDELVKTLENLKIAGKVTKMPKLPVIKKPTKTKVSFAIDPTDDAKSN